MTEHEAELTLLADLEEWWEDDEILHLYVFSWSMSHAAELSEDAKQRVYRKVYDELRRRHRMRLVWLPWPTDLAQAEDVVPGTPLDFTLDPDDPSTRWLLALIPAE